MIHLIILFFVIVISVISYIYVNSESDDIHPVKKDIGVKKDISNDYSFRTPKIKNKSAKIIDKNFKINAETPQNEEYVTNTSTDVFDDDDFINSLLNKGREEEEEDDEEEEEDDEDEEDDGTANRDKNAELKALDDMVLQAPEQFDIETLSQVTKRLGNTEKGKFAQKALEKKLKEKEIKRER